MKDFAIFIPTYRRADSITTHKYIPDNLKENTYLVVRHDESMEYKRYGFSLVELPERVKNLSQTRQYILDYSRGFKKFRYVMMLDDDLSFGVRSNLKRKTKTGYYYPILQFNRDGSDFGKMIKCLLDRMKQKNLAHVAISAREGNNRTLEDWQQNQRYMRAYIFDNNILGDFMYSDDCCGCEDFEMALQLITTGYPVEICYKYAQGQESSNAKGGLSVYRSIAYQNKAMQNLASRYPGIVKLREKTTKVAWGGATRLDATIFWKKAFNTRRLIGTSCPPANVLHPE